MWITGREIIAHQTNKNKNHDKRQDKTNISLFRKLHKKKKQEIRGYLEFFFQSNMNLQCRYTFFIRRSCILCIYTKTFFFVWTKYVPTSHMQVNICSLSYYLLCVCVYSVHALFLLYVKFYFIFFVLMALSSNV